ncbi:hypothetical protein [Microbispora sp. NPDC049125]|uniref:hypothetical protein n=1 Tax=Microbispora sp. NPDC049125 TaxID=3154929 RepID=UPI003466E334
MSARQLLTDLKAVGGRILAHATREDLADVIEPQLWTEHEHIPEQGTRSRLRRPAFAPPETSAAQAIAVTAALHILAAPTVPDAASRVDWLVSQILGTGRAATPTTVQTEWGRTSSESLHIILLKALNTRLRPSDQLRYRTTRARPTFPTPHSEQRAQQRADKVPQQLWPSWTQRLLGLNTGHNLGFFRQALASLLLVVGSRLKLSSSVNLLASTLSGRSISHLLQQLDQAHRDQILDTLIQLADYLDEYGSPIDYERRRRLDYSQLIPQEVWLKICMDSQTLPGMSLRHQNACRFLFQLLTGTDPVTAPPGFAINGTRDRAVYATFVRDLTPDLLEQLQLHGQRFLSGSGIADEPLTWEPPPGAAATLSSHADPALDIDRLHVLIRVQDLGVTAAAAEMGTTADHVRLVLEQSPAPAGPLPTKAPSISHLRLAEARKTLTPERLRQLYEVEHKSIRTIAAETGVSRRDVSILATEAGITLKTGRPSIAVDPDWLATEYMTHLRTLPDIAAVLGVSPSALSRCARDSGIPLRPRGGVRPICPSAHLSEKPPRLVRETRPEQG